MDYVDDDGYPTPEVLERLKEWDPMELDPLMEFLQDVWWPQNYEPSFEKEDGVWILHTNGWSGNEEILNTLVLNVVWWANHWLESGRGGHYKFGKLPVYDPLAMDEHWCPTPRRAAVAAEAERAAKPWGRFKLWCVRMARQIWEWSR